MISVVAFEGMIRLVPKAIRPAVTTNTRTDIRWLPCINTLNEVIPAGGVVRVIGLDSNGFYQVAKPNRDSWPYGIGFNDVVPIAKNATGQFTVDLPNWAAIDFEGSDPGSGDDLNVTPGETLVGPESGSWYLHDDQTSFMCVSEVDTDRGLVNVMRDIALNIEGSGETSDQTFEECKDGMTRTSTMHFINGIYVGTTSTEWA